MLIPSSIVLPSTSFWTAAEKKEERETLMCSWTMVGACWLARESSRAFKPNVYYFREHMTSVVKHPKCLVLMFLCLYIRHFQNSLRWQFISLMISRHKAKENDTYLIVKCLGWERANICHIRKPLPSLTCGDNCWRELDSHTKAAFQYYRHRLKWALLIIF